ncbi:dicarboxylate/amino acid:cation symporter [Acidipropionibacterium acidipropionici]|uniref:dicarboxylate/amino acid:cation symporter n=1 Tax=Acidipropionibacterium acidipropionici TaxID=1748 RepID=UPI00110C15B4|nr:dicarboxylate/amino acid:cation symporter [Acidipropionibacterium acidipropionici]QCV96006.1 dicarboxylate/amino acid:cation symporter [Acidipropionibacterium acidipropionici]
MKYLKSMTTQILIASVAGVVFGVAVGPWAANLKFVGDMFIRLIQMSMVPLVMCSVIVATGAMSGKGAGKLAGRTFGWIIGLSCVSALLAWGLSVLFKPGAGMVFQGKLDPGLKQQAGATSGWQETVLNFVSKNVVDAMSAGDMVPIIVFSLLFGAALNSYIAKTGRREVLTFFEQVQQVVLTMIRFVMKVAPIGIFCLLADLAGEVGFSVVTTALKYLGTTLLGVVILMVAFTLITVARTGVSLAKIPGKLAEQTVVAVTTTSSAVTFPTVLRSAVEKFGVSQRVANFTLSIGLTMGSYGAVLNYTIVVMFLAQAGGVHLSAGQVILGMVLAVLLNMGTITVPGGFPVVAMFLASALGLPYQAVGLLIAVDWFTGMFRTFLNVNGDTLVALLVAAGTDEIDRDVFDGKTRVSAQEIDPDEYQERFATADAAD